MTNLDIRKSSQAKEHNRNFIASLSHGLSILEAVADSATEIALGALANRVGLKRTSTWRLAHTLVDLGYLHQNPNSRNFRPAPRVAALGGAYLDTVDLKRLSFPFLKKLSVRYNETVSLAVLDRDEIVYIDRIETGHVIAIHLRVGSRLPLYNTSLGQALISQMPEPWIRQYIRRIANDAKTRTYVKHGGKKLFDILRDTRELGFALNDEDVAKGLRAIASPIYGRNSKVVAAIGISLPSCRATISELRHNFAPHLITTAGKISLALGYRPRQSKR